ncbi:type IV secretory system conjugative DNA transfer family protein [Streptomyces sp. A3M-1-3]|uniref:type IV secretory system conjugative DNA transfer family protein n=1 Tax=Streptomyces sp. A3M-1-3 TaxID=2962044 RepID=UPI0020B722F1|nr:type IV secretory system conjugative DNA transfer family protein [Streptomyces sp. A3M-1-3]MCP3821013.1 type IV secretory system conjugative DNA transfer family protein [Streptomyces sp. A3M-1-3]
MPHRDNRPGERGIPDSLLVGLLAFLLGLTLLVWTATGLAAQFARGAWPSTVTFARTPAAMRALVAQPRDIAGAWPDTAAEQLSGYGLFWGIFISELMVLVVATVFVMGVLARWRVVRANRRAGDADTYGDTAPAAHAGVAPAEAVAPVEAAGLVARERQAPVPVPLPDPVSAPVPPEAEPHPAATAQGPVGWEQPRAAGAPAPAPAPVAVPAPRPAVVLYGPAGDRRPRALRAIADAEGPALVVTSDPTLWAETKDARAKLGPVLVYDPSHLCDTPARLHWSPSAGCETREVAAARAVALLAPVRPSARLDAAVADAAETLLRCWLHAAAVDDRPFKLVHRWAQGNSAHEPVRILRTHPKAASGSAGELESALTAHPERREIAQELTARALSALSSIHIRDACTPNRTDSLTLESFVDEGGTLYLVGEAIEDPRSRPGAMPLLTALASSVVEHGRHMAARSSDGRLDPPLTLVLDDIAAVAPLPQLPELLTAGPAQGLPALALLRSQEQARARWPHGALPVA